MQTQQGKQDRRFSKSFFPTKIDAEPHEFYIKMWQIYPSVHLLFQACPVEQAQFPSVQWFSGRSHFQKLYIKPT